MLVRSFGVFALCLVLVSACVLDRDGKLVDASGGGGAGATGGGGPSTGGMAGPGGSGGMVNPPPSPVENLSVAVKTDAVVTWTNPDDVDLQGVLVVHRPGQAVSFSPVDGMAYGVGATPMANQEVVFAGPGTMTTLSPAVPGLRHHFAAWAFDDAFHYSAVRVADGLENDLGEQVAEIEISLAGMVTANVSPPNFPISGSAVYNATLDELTVELALRNNTARVVHNLKALLSSFNEGSVANAPLLPPGNGTPFLYYGPQGTDVGASKTRTFTIANVDGSVDPVTCTVTLRDDRWVIGHQRGIAPMRGQDSELLLVDSSGSLREATIAATATDGSINFRGIDVSSDGRTVYVGAKSKPFVTALDLVAFGTTSGVDLAAGNSGMVSGVALAPDGESVYAALTLGAHHWGSDGVGDGDGLGLGAGADAPMTTLSLVALDATTMMETQRVDILTDDADRRLTRTMAVSHDGTRAAVIVRYPLNSDIDAEIYFIDLEAFTLIDADPGTNPIDPVTVAAIRPDAVAWASDDNQLFVAIDGAVVAVDTTTFTQSEWTFASQLDRARALWVLGDVLYVAQSNVGGAGPIGAPASRFDTTTGVESALSTGLGETRGVVGFPGRAFFFSQNNMAVIDTTTHARLDMDGVNVNGITNIGLDGQLGNHFVAITPF